MAEFEKAPSFIERMLKFKIYGDSLYTTRVERELGWMGFVLLLQFALDFFAWTRTFSYAFDGDTSSSWEAVRNFLTPILLGFVFAAAIFAYDRSMVVLDPNPGANASEGFRIALTKKRKFRIPIGRSVFVYTTRIIVMLMLSLITAIPMELAVFKPEIDRRIAATEQAAVDGIRRDALNAENQRYAQSLGTTRSTVDNDVDTVRSRRNAERSSLVEQQNQERARLSRTINQANTEATAEAARPGRVGLGPRYQALIAQAESASRELAEFNRSAARALTDFDTATNLQVNGAQGTRNSTISTAERDHDERVQAIRTMAPAQLSARYGGTYLEPHGFLQRFRVLEELVHESRPVQIIVWGLRLLMISFGILIISLKLTLSKETDQYLSLRAQASNGNEDAKRIVSGMGYNNHQAYGMSSEARDILTDFYTYCHMAANELDNLRRAVIAFATEKERDGSSLAHSVIEGKLYANYMAKVVPTVGLMRAKADEIRLAGIGGFNANITAPDWPLDLNNGVDPRTPGYEPWRVEEHELEQHGWINPQPIKRELDQRIQEYKALRLELFIAIDEVEIDTENKRLDGYTVGEIMRARRGAWLKLLGILSKLDEIEERIKALKGSLPEWPRHTPDPRLTLRDRILGKEEDISSLRKQSIPAVHGN